MSSDIELFLYTEAVVIETFKETIPDSFRNRIKAVHGAKGSLWLDKLPELISFYSHQWQLSLEQYATHLTQNLIIFGKNEEDKKIVLKLGIPEGDIQSEITALNVFRGEGCVAAIKSDSKDGVILMDRVSPGTTLESLSLNGQDSKALHILRSVIEKLHIASEKQKIPEGVQTLVDWSWGFERLRARFGGTSGPFDSHVFECAENEFKTLLATQSKVILLHGDLHHCNILKSDDDSNSWVAIDPQGVVGDPIFEVAAFIRNPYPGIDHQFDLRKLLTHRLDQISDIFSYDRKKVRSWAFAQTALASCWSYEDSSQFWKFWWQLTQLLFEMKS